MSSFRPGIWSADPALIEQPHADWLWTGYLAAGKITLLTSLWKSGKTTLISLLLARRHTGGSLAGFPVRPGKTAVISEEEPDLWAERRRRLDFGPGLCLFAQPFDLRPTFQEWLDLLNHMLDLRAQHGLDLVVIDTLASFLPARCENNAVLVQESLQPLRRLTRAGLAVALLHHPRKGETRPGQSARGSGALAGFTDICLEMSHPGGDVFTRRRLLHALSRFQGTPRRLLLELNEAGTDYRACPEEDSDDFRNHWNTLVLVLEDAHHPLTRREILAAWPPDFPKPADLTLYRWLTRAVSLGLASSEGTGRKQDPFRYWLPANEERWKHDIFYQAYQDRRQVDEMLAKAGVPRY